MRLIPDRRTATALLVAGAMFMDILDATVIATSLPAMAKDFSTAPSHLSLGVSAYLVALTVFIPASGWAAARFGARRVFSAALCIFMLASILCALSSTLTEFTVARIIQGLGGAMMVPVGRAFVLRATPKQDIVKAIAILTWPALMAPLIGPVLGGWITTQWSWHWIFILNIPLGLFALIATLFLFENGQRVDKAFDLRGFLLSGLGFGLFMAGVEAASRRDLSWLLPLSFSVIGFLLLVAAFQHLWRTGNPLFNLRPLTIRTFRFSILTGSIFRICFSTIPFLLPLMLQIGMGYSPVAAGALLLWLFAGNLTIKPATTWLMNTFGFRRLLAVNGVFVAVGILMLATFTEDTPHWYIITVLFISGMNRSTHFTALNSLGYSNIPQHRMQDATTLQAVTQQMNRGTGIGLAALTLSISSMLLGHDVSAVPLEAFHLAFVVIAAIAFIAVIECLRLPANAGYRILRKARPATEVAP